ncbi:MAG: hypothetical protein WBM61_01430 [Woeseiaceae bacterium]
MNLFFWKNNKKIDAFASAVADEMYSFIQPDVAKDLFQKAAQKNKKNQRKTEQKLLGIVNQMQKFSEANSLGVYGKARLQKEFSDRLIELGYDGEVTRILVETILFRNA